MLPEIVEVGGGGLPPPPVPLPEPAEDCLDAKEKPLQATVVTQNKHTTAIATLAQGDFFAT